MMGYVRSRDPFERNGETWTFLVCIVVLPNFHKLICIICSCKLVNLHNDTKRHKHVFKCLCLMQSNCKWWSNSYLQTCF